MRTLTTIIATGMLMSSHAWAEDPISDAIEAFNSRDRSKPIEIETAAAEPEKGEPVLVTGKPPKDSELIDISEIPLDPEAAGDLPPSDVVEPKGLEVRVDQLQAGKGTLKPEKVRLLAPFPAKPLDEAPAGWLLETSSSAPAFQRQVELAPGKAITLTIRPHLLVPDADQAKILAVSEPGFEASLGYQQSDTVSAVLSDSIQKLDEDSRQIGKAIDQLQQLIVSLPKTSPAEPDSASSVPDAQNPIPKQP